MTNVTAHMTDDEVLQFTQHKRKELVDTLCEKGVPTDPKEQQVLLAALGDMDRTALTKKRLNSDNNNAAADREAQLAIAAIYQRVGNRSPFEVDANAPIEGVAIEVPEKLVEKLELVPGETEIGVKEMTYSQFMGE